MMMPQREIDTLDELLRRAVRRDKPDFDFARWKAAHADEIQTFRVQTKAERPVSLARPSLGRAIMTSRFTKTAAVVALAALLMLGHFLGFFKGTGVAYGVTDLPGLFERAKVIHIQGWNHFAGHRMPDGKRIRPVEVDNWIDLEGGRSRHTGTGLSVDKDGVRITIGETISDGPYLMRIDHAEKTVVFFRRSAYQQMREAYQYSQMMVGQMFGNLQEIGEFANVGWEEIDGVTYEIWERSTAQATTRFENRFRLWLSPSTGALGKVQSWSRHGDGPWELSHEYDKFDRDVDVPDEVFALEVPEGYVSKNTKATATLLTSGAGGGVAYTDERCSVRVNTRMSFTMSDGSVIVGWFSEDSKSETLAEDLFEGLEFGGVLPKLPVEIYGLKPGGTESNVTYQGRHLTYTQKADRFTEWSLYVPDGPPPASVRDLGYDVLYRFNLGDHNPKWTLGLNAEYGVPIENAEDFDRWVLGALVELSDDGAVPEDLTYGRVLQLAEQLR
jgi:hypothetical protein